MLSLFENSFAEGGISEEANRVATRRRQRLRFGFSMIGRCENAAGGWFACRARSIARGPACRLHIAPRSDWSRCSDDLCHVSDHSGLATIEPCQRWGLQNRASDALIHLSDLSASATETVMLSKYGNDQGGHCARGHVEQGIHSGYLDVCSEHRFYRRSSPTSVCRASDGRTHLCHRRLRVR